MNDVANYGIVSDVGTMYPEVSEHEDLPSLRKLIGHLRTYFGEAYHCLTDNHQLLLDGGVQHYVGMINAIKPLKLDGK